MNESKRLEKLQETSMFGSSEKLTYQDLLLLLREDREVRRLVRALQDKPAQDHADHADRYEAPKPVTYERLPPPPPAPDPLREELAPVLLLLPLLKQDSELANAWLGTLPENEGQQCLRLVVCASQWEVLSDFWEKIASRCKQAQRPAHSHEQALLAGAVLLHNLRWQGRQAQLVEVATGSPYDYERHQRGTPTGDTVRALWLAGLMNAGGQLHKKPLVQT
jgi:hypothetical protein